MEGGISSSQIIQQNKAFVKSPLFKDFKENILMMILEPLNVITLSFLRWVCKKFNFIITKKALEFKYFDSMSVVANITNIHMLKILQRFNNVKILKCHSKVTTSELSRFLDIVKPSLTEFYTEESHIDFSKLFRTTKLPNLQKFIFTNTKKSI